MIASRRNASPASSSRQTLPSGPAVGHRGGHAEQHRRRPVPHAASPDAAHIRDLSQPCLESHGTGRFEPSDLGALGTGCVIEEGVLVFNPRTVFLGDDVYIGHRTMLKGDTRGGPSHRRRDLDRPGRLLPQCRRIEIR